MPARWRQLTLLALLTATLAACQTGGTLDAPGSAIAGRYSAQAVVSDDAHHVLMAHVATMTRDGERVRAVVIHQRRDGVHRLRMREARLLAPQGLGAPLPYRAATRGQSGCTHGHCRDHAVGMIFLSDVLFAHARSAGLRARLIGREGVIDIDVPARLFTAADIPAPDP